MSYQGHIYIKGQVPAWNIYYSKKGVLMGVSKGRSIECEYLRAVVWNTSIKGQEYVL